MPNFRRQRVIGWVIRSLAVLFVLAINTLLLWRIFFSANIPEEIDTLSVNQALLDAYDVHGDDLQLLYQDQATVTRAEKNYGYFAVPKCTFIPEANQVQVVFRYNNGTLTNLAEDYALDSVPARDAELFDVSLVVTVDKTPDNADDNTDPATLEKRRVAPTESKRATTTLYTYYLYVFENVSVAADTAGVFVDVYYLDDVNYDEEAYGTLCLYSPDDEWLEHSFTRSDKDALEKN